MVKKRAIKQAKKDPITLTIRATEVQEITLLGNLKEITGSKTYSGAIFEAARLLPDKISTVESLRKQVNDLQKSKRDQDYIIQSMFHGHLLLENYGKKNFKDLGKHPEPEIPFDDDDFDDDES